MITLNEILQQLLEIQGVDLVLDEMEKNKKASDGALNTAREGETAARNGLIAGKELLDKIQKERKALELESKAKQEAISKHKQQVYEVKSNEAYAALNAEIARLSEENARVEEQVIAKMVDEDDRRKDITALQGKVKEAEAALKAEEERHRQAVAAIDTEITAKEALRAVTAAKLDKNILGRYERIRKNKGGLAVARVVAGTCEGCRMTVRPQLQVQIREAHQLMECDSCSRILYLE